MPKDIRKGEEDEKELEEDLEENFLEGRIQYVIQARYNSDSDESISFSDNIIAEECC